MSSLMKLKTEAAALEAQARASGRPLKHCSALEQVAKLHGYKSWRACVATLPEQAVTLDPPLECADMGGEMGGETGNVAMKHYHNPEWGFRLDIPRRWNRFPAVADDIQKYEITRFASNEDGYHVLIIFRHPVDPRKGQKAHLDRIQQQLAASGHFNFAISETVVGSRPASLMTFDKQVEVGFWSVREYFIFDETLAHVLGFGTTDRDRMFPLYDRIVNSFTLLEDPFAD
jgi:hypothetical protein